MTKQIDLALALGNENRAAVANGGEHFRQVEGDEAHSVHATFGGLDPSTIPVRRALPEALFRRSHGTEQRGAAFILIGPFESCAGVI
jgi:hypothetical protein